MHLDVDILGEDVFPATDYLMPGGLDMAELKRVKELEAENAKLTRENARLNKKLRRAELIIDLQKKVSQILGITLPVLEESDDDEVSS